MAANVSKFPGEPIVVLTLDDHSNTQTVTDLYLDGLTLAQGDPGQGEIHWVLDISAAQTSYSAFVVTLTETIKGLAGASIQPDFLLSVVGQPYQAAAIESQNLVFFSSLDAAADAVRSQMAAFASR